MRCRHYQSLARLGLYLLNLANCSDDSYFNIIITDELVPRSHLII